MRKNNLTLLAILALFLAWSFDQLFWQKAVGISFFLFVLLCFFAGFILSWRAENIPAWTSLLLLAPILYFAGMTFLRLEPFTLLVDFGLALAGMLMLSLTWLGGRWWQYTLSDYALNTLRWVGSVLVKPFQSFLPQFLQARNGEGLDDQPTQAEPDSATVRDAGRARPLLAVLLGLLLAFPLVSLLAMLLAQADLLFAQQLRDFFQFFDLEKISEYIFRLTYILILAFLLSGVYLHALLQSREERLSGGESVLKTLPFLNWLAAVTILVCVDLLFIFFVIVQFRYFFGGRANIALDGFTYAEYARRGFGELLAVAFISFLVFLGLSAITRREQARSRWAFSASGLLLVALVAVILVSAFQRLLLYEAAYGFTRIRTYTHVFMLWLGLLLAAMVVLESLGAVHRFGLTFVLVSLGFGATLNVLNVDAFIVRQNVARAVRGGQLDTAYLVSLSDDAVPALFSQFDIRPEISPVRDQVGAVLACRSAFLSEQDRARPWPSYHASHARAARLFEDHQSTLAAYPLRRVDGRWQVILNDQAIACQYGPEWRD
jgi:hypothetical protein